jgi:hypothetical protein
VFPLRPKSSDRLRAALQMFNQTYVALVVFLIGSIGTFSAKKFGIGAALVAPLFFIVAIFWSAVAKNFDRPMKMLSFHAAGDLDRADKVPPLSHSPSPPPPCLSFLCPVFGAAGGGAGSLACMPRVRAHTSLLHGWACRPQTRPNKTVLTTPKTVGVCSKNLSRVQFYDWMRDTTVEEEEEMKAHNWDIEDTTFGPLAVRYKQPSLVTKADEHAKVLQEAQAISDNVSAFNAGERVLPPSALTAWQRPLLVVS